MLERTESPQRPEIAVRCGGSTYLGALVSTRAEWSTDQGVLVSIVALCADEVRRRFYFRVTDGEAWRHLEANPPRVIEAEAMKEERA